jgi:hypothetical protein
MRNVKHSIDQNLSDLDLNLILLVYVKYQHDPFLLQYAKVIFLIMKIKHQFQFLVISAALLLCLRGQLLKQNEEQSINLILLY